MCLPSKKRYENIVAQLSSRVSGAVAARPLCTSLAGSLLFQSRRARSPFSSAKIVQGEPGFLCDGC